MEKTAQTQKTGQTSLGLSSRTAEKLLFEHGENKLESGKKISALKIFTGQFKDLMIMILLASTVISVLMGEITEAITIIVIVLLNAILGFVQEYRTEKTLEALKGMASPTARVLRDGKEVTIQAAQIVPGDVVFLKAGDKVPADGKLIEIISLQCDEAMLSGESVPVEKSMKEGSAGQVYMGTVITKGRGKAEITATGMKTEMGKIAGMLHEIEDEETPLQKRLAQLGKYIAIGCLLICAIVSVTGILRGEDVFGMMITGISLAVAAVPEGLPAIVTIALALAVRRILKRQALVRRLHSVETLGCANVICTDKTGTLTENRMTVRRMFTLDYNVSVSGNGHQQAGEFTVDGRRIGLSVSPTLKRLVDIAAGCNNATISDDKWHPGRDRTKSSAEGEWTVDGDPTEIALLVMAAKAGVTREALEYERTGEIPFDSDRKRMTVQLGDKLGRNLSFSKGAPDLLLDQCRYVLTDSGVQVMTPDIVRRITQANKNMAKDALRVLGFACKENPGGLENCEKDLVFVGLVGMIDPPRKEAYDAVAKCRQAKIRTVMITGDHKDTAVAIAKDIGIMRAGERVLTGREIDSMPDDEFAQICPKVSVFARVSPGHKLKIVRCLKDRGDIVAMTGDGVNDAPAIKEADIGVSMGITGTDVTKQAASIILLDDNFATLVAAIEEGRVVYSNIRKFIRYLISCNIGEVVTMFAGMLMGMPVVLLPIQILLVNLVTDGLPAMALGLEPAESGVMNAKPRPAGESVFSNGLLSRMIFRGILIGFTTLAIFATFMRQTGNIDVARTGALMTLVMTQLFHVFECKSESKSIFKIEFMNNPALIGAAILSFAALMFSIYNPWLQSLLSTASLELAQIAQVIGYSLIAPLLSALLLTRPKKKLDEEIVLPTIQEGA